MTPEGSPDKLVIVARVGSKESKKYFFNDESINEKLNDSWIFTELIFRSETTTLGPPRAIPLKLFKVVIDVSS